MLVTTLALSIRNKYTARFSGLDNKGTTAGSSCRQVFDAPNSTGGAFFAICSSPELEPRRQRALTGPSWIEA